MEITCQSVAETFMQPNSTTEDFSASLMGLVNGSHKRLWRLANILDGTAQPCLYRETRTAAVCQSVAKTRQLIKSLRRFLNQIMFLRARVLLSIKAI